MIPGYGVGTGGGPGGFGPGTAGGMKRRTPFSLSSGVCKTNTLTSINYLNRKMDLWSFSELFFTQLVGLE